MDKRNTRLVAAALECVGIVVTSVGIGCELSYGADYYWAVITAGSCLVAVGSLLWAKVK